MPPRKTQPIDFNTEYPCPCRRRGRLQPITLTEAFGCDRCQRIFVVEENAQVLEELSTSYPYKRAWRWTGKSWTTAYSAFSNSYLHLWLGICIPLVIIFSLLALHSTSHLMFAVVLGLVVLMLAIVFWLAYRP